MKLKTASQKNIRVAWNQKPTRKMLVSQKIKPISTIVIILESGNLKPTE
jgi:hypothetical protein